MKRLIFISAAVVSVLLCRTETVSAQSALKRLENLIRSQRSGAPEEAPASSQPAAQAADEASQPQGYLGVVADDRQDRGRGVRLVEVRPGSPAEKSGLNEQDLVTAVGGIRVRQMDDMAAVLDQMAPGDSLEFEVLRGDTPLTLEVTFGTRGKPKPGALEEVVTPSPEPAEKPPSAPEADLPSDSPPMVAKPDAVPPKEQIQDDRALIERLQRRIEELERRVQALERLLNE